MNQKRLAIVSDCATLEYAKLTIHDESSPSPTRYCKLGGLHSKRAGFFWLHSCRVKNGCVLLRTILKHGIPAEVIVHQTRTENHRSIKRALGTSWSRPASLRIERSTCNCVLRQGYGLDWLSRTKAVVSACLTLTEETGEYSGSLLGDLCA